MRRSLALAGPPLITGALYFGLAMFAWNIDPTVGSPFWPATGLTIGVFAISGRRRWPALAAAVFAAEIAADLLNGVSGPAALAFGAADVIEPILGASLLLRGLDGPFRFRHPGDVARFVVTCALIPPAVGGAIGGGTIALSDGTSWPEAWFRWATGDGVGVLVVAPAVLLLGTRPRRARASRLEAALLMLLVVAAVASVFTWLHAAFDLHNQYALLPLVVWAATRFGVRGAALSSMSIAMIGNVATAFGWGPFADPPRILEAQMFFGSVAISALAMATMSASLTERSDEVEEMTRKATRDPLTGIPNRLALVETVERQRLRAARNGTHAAMWFVDVDDFKDINDRFGHRVGDEVLIGVAARIDAILRRPDSLLRIGGDEFVAVCGDLPDPRALDAVASRIHGAFDEPLATTAGTVRVCVSVGAAVLEPGTDLADAVHAADAAMYREKRARRAS